MTTVRRTGSTTNTRRSTEAKETKEKSRQTAPVARDGFGTASARSRTTVGGATRRDAAVVAGDPALQGELQQRVRTGGRPTVTTPTDPTLPVEPPKPEGLTVGSKGKAVKSAETMLKRAGFIRGKADGTFTRGTENAVKAFQDSVGLEATGVVDKATREKLRGVSRRVLRHGNKIQGRGQKNGHVLKMERRLKTLGYDVGRADGTYDAQTADAVKRFRQDQSKDIRKGSSNVVGGGFRNELTNEIRKISHNPYRSRVKPSAERRRADRRTAAAAAREHRDGTVGMGRGSKGESIKTVKQHLQHAGFDPGHINKSFDERTEGAVKNFQRRSKLPVTGRVDARTWRKLSKSTLEAKDGTSPKQMIGERSGAVRNTEKMLKKLGLNPGEVDGVYTAATERAVDRFRARRKMEKQDGVGSHTVKMMRKAIRERSNSGPISARGKQQMRNLVQNAIANSAGKRPMGWCLREVGDILDRTTYGKIGRGGLPRFPYARNVAEYLNEDRRYAKLGLKRLKLDNPYKAPAGAIIVVRPGTPGTAHPTAGDIVIAAGNGRFLNDGEMGYGGPQNFPKGNNYVMGIYVPK